MRNPNRTRGGVWGTVASRRRGRPQVLRTILLRTRRWALATIVEFAFDPRRVWLDEIDRGGRGIYQPAQGPLGRALRGLRQDLWLSQERLGAIAGVSQTTISRLELGRHVNWSLFCRLVEAAGGRPVVTIERIPTERELFAEFLKNEGFGDDSLAAP